MRREMKEEGFWYGKGVEGGFVRGGGIGEGKREDAEVGGPYHDMRSFTYVRHEAREELF